MNFKKYFFISIGGIAISLLTIISIVVIVDPYQQYHMSSKYFEEERYLNPGIAKHHDYDAVIIGSSMAMNHYPSQIDSLLGWNTINLTTKGATDADYALLLPYISKINKVKHIIWDIDYFSFSLPSTESLSELYLYDNKCWNDFPYWLNYTSCMKVIDKLTNRNIVNSRDSMYHADIQSGKENLLKHYKKDDCNAYFSKDNFDNLKLRFDILEKDIMPILSGIDLYIYFPPYSICEFIKYSQYGCWEEIKDFKKYIIEHLLSYPNVRLYDFQKEEFICNLDEYMDLRHHSDTYNKRIIENIAKDNYRVSTNNYIKDLEILDSLVCNYKIIE